MTCVYSVMATCSLQRVRSEPPTRRGKFLAILKVAVNTIVAALGRRRRFRLRLRSIGLFQVSLKSPAGLS